MIEKFVPATFLALQIEQLMSIFMCLGRGTKTYEYVCVSDLVFGHFYFFISVCNWQILTGNLTAVYTWPDSQLVLQQC
jgi:hypothetical protein